MNSTGNPQHINQTHWRLQDILSSTTRQDCWSLSCPSPTKLNSSTISHPVSWSGTGASRPLVSHSASCHRVTAPKWLNSVSLSLCGAPYRNGNVCKPTHLWCSTVATVGVAFRPALVTWKRCRRGEVNVCFSFMIIAFQPFPFACPVRKRTVALAAPCCLLCNLKHLRRYFPPLSSLIFLGISLSFSLSGEPWRWKISQKFETEKLAIRG